VTAPDRRAGSMASGRLVAPMTTTAAPFVSIASSSRHVRNWATIRRDISLCVASCESESSDCWWISWNAAAVMAAVIAPCVAELRRSHR